MLVCGVIIITNNLTIKAMRYFFYTSFCFLLVMLNLKVEAQTVRYVMPTSQGNGSGDSWANASDSLQKMMNSSGVGDEI